jgi:hypothetical protein
VAGGAGRGAAGGTRAQVQEPRRGFIARAVSAAHKNQQKFAEKDTQTKRP